MTEAILTVGTYLDDRTTSVYGDTSFTYNDNFAYEFFYPKAFNQTTLLMRLSKKEDKGEKIVLSGELEVNPTQNHIYNITPANQFYVSYRKGDFELS